MWRLRRGPVHKRRLLLHLKLARVEENFSVSVSVDCVARLLDVERTGPTVHMAWLFAVWCDCYFQRSDMLILKDDLVIFRRCFYGIQVFRPRACLLGALRFVRAPRTRPGHQYR